MVLENLTSVKRIRALTMAFRQSHVKGYGSVLGIIQCMNEWEGGFRMGVLRGS